MAKGKIIFSPNILKSFNEFCDKKKFNSIVFIFDKNTDKYCSPLFKNKIKNKIIISAGEANKNLKTYSFIIQKLIAFNANKNTLIVNVGGGLVSDIGAFAASTYQRGISFVNIPTTLVGMADAAIGGKTGIDFENYKNYVGTIALAERVFIAPQFLKTLPKKETESGWAEMIKTGLIANKKLIDLIVNEVSIDEVILCCANTKHNIVLQDLKDKNIRQLLNFGHTIGHAYESYRLSINKPILHGFAVAKGILAESKIAYQLGKLSEIDYLFIQKLIKKYTFQTEILPKEFKLMKKWLKADKKNKNNQIIFSLPNAIGKGTFGISIAEKDLESLIF